MDTMFDLSIPDILFDTLTESPAFTEFTQALDEAAVLYLPEDLEVQLEAVQPRNRGYRKDVTQIKNNTRDVNHGILSAYGDITDAGGNLIRATVNLVLRCINLMSRVVTFLVNKLTIIPNAILKLGETIMDTPQNIVDKIQGNIELYITAQDLQDLYNKHLIAQLDAFISLANVIVQGDSWGNIFRPRNSQGTRNKPVNPLNVFAEDDLKHIKRMNKMFLDLKGLEFSPTKIHMKDPAVVKIYFSNNKAVHFWDLKGRHFNGTYYAALAALMEDLKARRNELNNIRTAMSNKYDRTLANSEFAKMKPADQTKIARCLQQMATLFSIVGNMVRYVMIDMQTIRRASNKILEKSNMIKNSSPAKAGDQKPGKIQKPPKDK